MWKHVLPPVVLVIVIWMTISLATSAYIGYSDRVHQRILKENVSSIEAACDLQVACWRLVGSDLTETKTAVELEARFNPRLQDIRNAMRSLHRSASTVKERQILREMEGNLEAMEESRERIVRDRHAEDVSKLLGQEPQAIVASAMGISDYAMELRKYNSLIIQQEEVEQQRLLSRMMLIRNFTLFLGPIVGVVVGWRITSSLQRRVSTLAITLRSVASNTVYTVGEYSLRGADDLREIQHLSEKVIEQMQRIGSDLERAELEIIQSERLAAVGELAAGVAHELRNPLTSVKLLLQHAATVEDRGHLSISNMDLLLTEISRMEVTIQGLLDFSRPVNLSCLVHDVRVPLQRAVTLVSGRAIANRVSIHCELEDEPLFVNGDVEQLHLVFVNLLINAVESMPTGGVIMVDAMHSRANRSIRVEVRDRGTGIPEEIVKKLFEPFVTTKERGTGLGLALCYRIVTNHQGTISAANQTQGGAVFRMELPAAVASPVEREKALK